MVVALEVIESLVLIGADDIRNVLLGVYITNSALWVAFLQ